MPLSLELPAQTHYGSTQSENSFNITRVPELGNVDLDDDEELDNDMNSDCSDEEAFFEEELDLNALYRDNPILNEPDLDSADNDPPDNQTSSPDTNPVSSPPKRPRLPMSTTTEPAGAVRSSFSAQVLYDESHGIGENILRNIEIIHFSYRIPYHIALSDDGEVRKAANEFACIDDATY